MQPKTAETPQYAKAGNAYETSTAKPINPVGLYYNPGNGLYIGTTHEIQGDALIRQGYELVEEGRTLGKLSDKEIATNFKDGKRIEKKTAKSTSTKKTADTKSDEKPQETLSTPADEFTPEDDSEGEENTQEEGAES